MSQHKQKEQEQEALVLEALIIGAGPAGLIAAYHLKETCRFGPPPKYSSDSRGDTSSNRNDNYKSKNKYSRGRMVILEETSAPGGLWNRDPINREKIPCYCVDDSSIENDNDAKKSNHVDSTSGNKTRIAVETSSQPLYENLSVNFPKDLMSFCNAPFSSKIPSFPYAETITSYYRDYVNKVGFEKEGYIQYNSRVTECFQNNNDHDNGNYWTVKTNKGDIYRTKRVLVCTGHYRKAFAPSIVGIRHFINSNSGNNNNDDDGKERENQRRIIHSSAFGSVHRFVGRRVLIIGGGISGSDIAHHLGRDGKCQRIVVSVRNKRIKEKMLLSRSIKLGGVRVRPGVKNIDEDGNVHFVPGNTQNGFDKDNNNTAASECIYNKEQFDDIIVATGYRYWYPFLTSELRAQIMSNDAGYKLQQLYLRMIYVHAPSLVFFGITNVNLPASIAIEYQTCLYAQLVQKGEDTKLCPEMMRKEVASRYDDTSQDDLGPGKFPAYIGSLARVMSSLSSGRQQPKIDGYWMHLLKYRLPLLCTSLWVQRQYSVLGYMMLVPGMLLAILASFVYALYH